MNCERAPEVRVIAHKQMNRLSTVINLAHHRLESEKIIDTYKVVCKWDALECASQCEAHSIMRIDNQIVCVPLAIHRLCGSVRDDFALNCEL
jgi:hypothetical protein